MTQTKRCPIFKFGSWWCFHRQTPQESDCEINASFAQGCVCVINASRRCGVPATGCCGTGPCLYQSSVRITEHQGQAGQSLGPLWNQLPLGMGGDDRTSVDCSVQQGEGAQRPQSVQREGTQGPWRRGATGSRRLSRQPHVPAYNAMLGLRWYTLCVSLRSSTWTLHGRGSVVVYLLV